MTMRVRVVNEDATRTLLVVPVDDGVNQTTQRGRPTELQPGQSAGFYVYSTHSLSLEEKP